MARPMLAGEGRLLLNRLRHALLLRCRHVPALSFFQVLYNLFIEADLSAQEVMHGSIEVMHLLPLEVAHFGEHGIRDHVHALPDPFEVLLRQLHLVAHLLVLLVLAQERLVKADNVWPDSKDTLVHKQDISKGLPVALELGLVHAPNVLVGLLRVL